jgi:general secretion pathway protein D
LNADPRLIEIEARFVEVCQEDLNSLGFEWILNSDYSLGLGKHISRALGIRDGVFGSSSIGNGTSTEVAGGTNNGNGSGSGMDQNTNTLQPEGGAVQPSKGLDLYDKSVGASWFRSGKDHNGNIGLNAIGGESTYTTGHRYLSTLGNHVSGEGVNNNDQFMRLNAFIGGADLSMILHMLSQRSDTDLLSAPKVLTRPGEEAVMKVVTEYIYPTDYDVQLQSSRSGGYDSSSQSAILAVVEPQSFTMREVGVILQATPTLTDDGNLIDLKLKADVVDEPTWKNYGMRIPFTGNASQTNFEGIGEIFTGLSSILATLGATLAPEAKEKFANTAVESASSALNALSSASNNNITYYDAPMEQPFFHVRSIDSSVSVYPGATIVMGGLITEARRAMDDKIPYLGDLPFIGRFFRSHAEQTVKRNLLIFVTTRLVDVRGREVKMNEAKDIKDAKPDVQASPASETTAAN